MGAAIWEERYCPPYDDYAYAGYPDADIPCVFDTSTSTGSSPIIGAP